ncbi:MAG TPA: aminopeptidase [Parvularcula sp.]|nr:aminopeptidase [Parvularcula sp.]
MSFKRVGFAALFAALAVGCATGAPAPDLAGAAARLKADIAWLADDARAGREAGTPGYDAAADYVAAEFEAAGLSPGADGGWRQTVPLRASMRDLDAARMTIDGNGGFQTLVHLTDYIVGRSFTDANFEASGDLVYVGYGVAAPSENYDDYAGLDVAGKIVVAFAGAPRGFSTELAAYFSDAEAKQKTAAAKGAVGFISMQSNSSGFPWPVAVKFAGAPATGWAGPDGRTNRAAPPIRATAFMSESGAKKLFSGEALDYLALRTMEAASGAPKGFPLKKRARVSGASKFSETKSDNIIGVIEGADPALRDEVILLTAHLDHIGVDDGGKPGEDVINNGAMDNAAGVAVLIEAANMFRRNRRAPRRTIAFAAVTAEEKGLIGADYLAHHPAFGGKRIVANVNLDMPVLLYPFTDVVAFGAERSSIGPAVAAAAEAMGVKLSPDPIPEEGIFTRSDHYSFVKQGVPSVFLITGFENGGGDIFRNFLATHYHAPSDDISLPILYDQGARFTELNYRIARALADADAAPSWNKGDFFGETFGKR